MRAKLPDARTARFSETARSRPRAREAGRNRAEVGGAATIGRRRLTDDRPERPAEGAEAREADVEADLAHLALGLAQEEHRPLDPPALEVAVRGLAEGGAEDPDEVRLRDVRDPSQAGDVERLCVVAIHRIPRAQHAAIGLLDRPTHAAEGGASVGGVPLTSSRGRTQPLTSAAPPPHPPPAAATPRRAR